MEDAKGELSDELVHTMQEIKSAYLQEEEPRVA